MLEFSLSPAAFRLQRFANSVSVLAIVSAFLFCSTPDNAFSSGENELLDSSVRPIAIGRAGGLVYVDLPMRLRARFDTKYTGQIYTNDTLAKPYAVGVGPSVRGDHSLENRVALTRSISDRIEIGIVCGARSPLGILNFFELDRVTVGAMVRIVP